MKSELTQNKVVSLDSSKVEVCRHFDQHFDIINDVSGNQRCQSMLEYASESLKPIIITHNTDGFVNNIQTEIIDTNDLSYTENIVDYF